MNKKAFTLIELLIVVTIIGILAVALVPRIVGGSMTARDSARRADVQSIVKGMEIYLSENGTFSGLGAAGDDFCGSDLNGALSEYIGAVPTDPKSDNSATFLFGNGTGSDGDCTTDGEYVVTILNDDGKLTEYAVGARLEGKYVGESNVYRGWDVESVGSTYSDLLSRLQAATDGSSRDYFVVY